MARLFSRTFKSLKPHNSDHNLKPLLKPPRTPASTPSKLEFALSSSKSPRISKNPWFVYLILSTNPPIKTYVGVTTNFSCRLKQHNGELKGGAKASRAGRPWVCACLINGFSDKSEACKFESKWKLFSRKLSRKKKTNKVEKQEENGSLASLHQRHAALSQVQSSVIWSHLEIDWHLNLS